MRDPFEPTASPRAYLPRPATEAALAALAGAARAGNAPAALTGPAGMGKTLLLHVLGDRLGREMRFVYLPHAGLEPSELAAWALARLGLKQSSDSLGALIGHARELAQAGAALLLLLDDAHTLSLPSARELGRIAARSQRALRLVLAADDAPATAGVLAAISPELTTVRLDARLDRAELDAYLDRRLERAEAPPRVRERFHVLARDALERGSEGVPAALDAAAAALLAAPLGASAAAADSAAPAAETSASGDARPAAPPARRRPESLRVSSPIPRRQAPALAAPPGALWLASLALAAALALALAGFIR